MRQCLAVLGRGPVYGSGQRRVGHRFGQRQYGTAVSRRAGAEIVIDRFAQSADAQRIVQVPPGRGGRRRRATGPARHARPPGYGHVAGRGRRTGVER